MIIDPSMYHIEGCVAAFSSILLDLSMLHINHVLLSIWSLPRLSLAKNKPVQINSIYFVDSTSFEVVFWLGGLLPKRKKKKKIFVQLRHSHSAFFISGTGMRNGF